nr:MAG TPA: hypothetical protein [Caudoviricetes sp.]
MLKTMSVRVFFFQITYLIITYLIITCLTKTYLTYAARFAHCYFNFPELNLFLHTVSVI